MKRPSNALTTTKKNGELIERAFFPLLFVLCPLPYKDPKSDFFTRKYGDVQLDFFCTSKGLGIPSGTYPRSLLSLITTQYMRQRNNIDDDKEKRTVRFESLADTGRQMGIGTLNGRTGSHITNTLWRLGGLGFSTTSKFVSGKFNINRRENYFICDGSEIVWSKKEKNEIPELFQSFVRISPQFSELVEKHTTQVNLGVYLSLKTALQQDLYAWLSRKIYVMNKAGAEKEVIKFNQLLPQFFTSTVVTAKPRQQEMICSGLLAIRQASPEIKAEATKEGLVLRASPLIVPEKDKGFV